MRLIPREEKYFTWLNQMASKVRSGAELFVKIFQDFENRVTYADQIKAIELACDELSATIVQRLNATFITPIDREDIYLLTTELDDVIDMINDLARRLDIYDINKPRPDVAEITDLLAKSTMQMEAAFNLIERHQSPSEHCRTISQLEKRADSLYSDALRRLFKDET